jgi:excisionase family DNA binding protein
MKEQSVTGAQRTTNPRRQPKGVLQKRLFNISEASVYLGRSIPAIRELIWKGHLPIVKLDRRIHLDLFDLDRFIEQHKTTYTF